MLFKSLRGKCARSYHLICFTTNTINVSATGQLICGSVAHPSSYLQSYAVHFTLINTLLRNET